jgi:hypothetical protein
VGWCVEGEVVPERKKSRERERERVRESGRTCVRKRRRERRERVYVLKEKEGGMGKRRAEVCIGCVF